MLGDITPQELEQIVHQSMGRSPIPELADEQVRRRALGIAQRQGVLKSIEERLACDRPIAVVPHSRFREYLHNGNRTHCQELMHWRNGQIDLAATACYLGLDRLEYLQDLLWAECETTWWILAAHERHCDPIDLRAATNACQYAQVVALLKDRLAGEVRDRVVAEIQRRVLSEFLAESFWWETRDNNWNAVCLGGVGFAAMLVEKDPKRLAAILQKLLTHLPAFLDSFTPDGGCSEGPSYWRFGFGWYVRLASALHQFTGGRINIMAGERIHRICRFALAASVCPGQDLLFADAHAGFLSAETAILTNRFQDLPELFGLCDLTADGSLVSGGLMNLLLNDGRRHEPLRDTQDYYLPDLAVAKVRSDGLTVAAKAGHNAENHNHNDVGSFLVHRGGTFFLCDPGAPIYSAKTFSERRYESVFCNSFGHSVPLINGRMQPPGREFAGTLSAEGLAGRGGKTLRLHLGRAYGMPALKELERVIHVPPGGRRVELTERFVFASPPESLEEAFLTHQPASVSADGGIVVISSPCDGTAELRATDGQGRFHVRDLTEEIAAESRDGQPLRRITFVPDPLDREMTLRFVLEFR